MKENYIEWLETKIELNKRMIDNDTGDFNDFLKNDNQMLSEIINILKTLEVKEVTQ